LTLWRNCHRFIHRRDKNDLAMERKLPNEQRSQKSHTVRVLGVESLFNPLLTQSDQITQSVCSGVWICHP